MAKRSATSAHMVIGAGVMIFRLHACRSLKSKRSVVKKMIHKVCGQFNASVAEVGAHDIYELTHIGFAMAGSDQKVIDAKIDKLINFTEDLGLAELVDTEIEIIHL